jgi:hypothetical protein
MTEIQKYEFSTEKPAYLADENSLAGFDTGETPPMPLVRIVQKSSKEIDAGTAKPGDVWSDAHGGVIAEFDPKKKSLKAAIHLVPCKQQIEYLHFETDAGNAKHPALVGPFWRTSNPDDPKVQALANWKSADGTPDDQAWRVRTRHVLVALPINHDSLAVEAGVLSFMGAAWSIGRKAFLLEAQRAVKAPLAAQVWEMNVEAKSNDAGQVYYVPVLRFAGIAPQELYQSCTETSAGFGALVPQLDAPKAEVQNPTDPADDIPF